VHLWLNLKRIAMKKREEVHKECWVRLNEEVERGNLQHLGSGNFDRASLAESRHRTIGTRFQHRLYYQALSDSFPHRCSS
ncbi:hypothetical protein Dsin_022782, partial [Dipteronia sinensis]